MEYPGYCEKAGKSGGLRRSKRICRMPPGRSLMIRIPYQPRLLVLLLLLVAFQGDASTQGRRVEILLPGDEYQRNDLPAAAAGTWWVLHRPGGQAVLEAMEAVVTSFQGCGDEDSSPPTGRTVRVPTARDPVLLIRGLPGLGPGSVRAVFFGSPGAGQSARVEVSWDDSKVVLQRVVHGTERDQPGEYRVELLVGTRRYRLHGDRWYGDGHWRVRWIGDLNRDGWPDLLFDASYKYSLNTTRLYLSREGRLGLEFSEVATLTTSAC